MTALARISRNLAVSQVLKEYALIVNIKVV
jgi:hypothetical protein